MTIFYIGGALALLGIAAWLVIEARDRGLHVMLRIIQRVAVTNNVDPGSASAVVAQWKGLGFLGFTVFIGVMFLMLPRGIVETTSFVDGINASPFRETILDLLRHARECDHNEGTV